MASIASISQPFFFCLALFCIGCVKKGDVPQNYTIVKTEIDEVQRVAGILLAESDRLLDEEFSGEPEHRASWEKARERRKWERVLFLPHLKKINPTQAKAIAENASWVYLNGLKSLSPEIAQEIFVTEYVHMELNGLEEISPKTAVYMGRVSPYSVSRNSLSLGGLKEITPEVAKGLMSEEGDRDVYLEGVTSISDEAVQMISRTRPDVRKRFVRFHMPNLKLTPELAEKLPEATLSSVISKESMLSEELVEMIAKSNVRYLHLNNLKDIQPAQLSEILRRERTIISLDGIRKLKRGMAQELARVSPDLLSLNGVQSLCDEDIDTLVQSDIETLYVKGLQRKEYKKLANAFRKSHRNIVFKSE